MLSQENIFKLEVLAIWNHFSIAFCGILAIWDHFSVVFYSRET